MVSYSSFDIDAVQSKVAISLSEAERVSMEPYPTLQSDHYRLNPVSCSYTSRKLSLVNLSHHQNRRESYLSIPSTPPALSNAPTAT